MTAIILPRKHFSQPKGRVQIDWANPLSQGLRVAFTGSGPNLVNGEMPAGTGGRGADSLGDWFYPTASADNLRFNLFPEIPADSDFTVFWINNVQTTSTARKRAFRLGNNSFGTIMAWDNGVNNNRGELSFQNSSGTFVMFPTLSNHLRFEPARHVVRRSVPYNMIAFRADAETRENRSTINSVLRGPFNYLDVGNNLTTFPLQGFIGNFLLWDRFLYLEEVLHLEENIWSVYKADPVRIYSFPATGIPTLSLPGVIDITATSARPQVTLTY